MDIQSRNEANVKYLFTILLFASFAIAQPHGVRFSWTQSPTPGITANDLYCGTSTRSYNLRWAFSTPTVEYDWLTTDGTHPPTQGQMYFCAVTAKKGAIDSDYSPELTFRFPSVPLPPPGLSITEH